MQDSSEKNESRKLGYLGIRHLQSLMLFFALLLCYTMRVNMSMAIISMTDKTKENTFDWNMQTQSVILSSFFWGYIVLQLPGGMLASRIGGKILLCIALSVNSVVSLLVPLAAKYGGWQLVCACRVLQGLTQGFVFPTTHHLIGKWVPLDEKSRLGTFIYSGTLLGTAIQLVVSGYIAEYWGWPSIFYVNGCLGAVWVAVYVFVGSDTPQSSSAISDAEKNHIESSLGQIENKNYRIPWKSIWTSVPFMALIVVHSGQNWGYWTLMTEIPSYMNKVLGIDIKKNGILSATPYLTMFILSFPVGYISDYILNKKWLSITVSRKLFNSIAQVGPAFALIGLSYVPEGNVTIVVVLLSIIVGLNAGQYAGFMLVHIDMAPNFAGPLMGITNGLSNIISIIAPLIAGIIIKDETSPTDWRKVFFLASFIYLAVNLVFVLFGTSERQKWNELEEQNITENGEDITTTKELEERNSRISDLKCNS